MAEQQLNEHLALEMIMQDVLGNLEELSLDLGYSDGIDCFEILAIVPTTEDFSTTDNSPYYRVRSPFTAETYELQPRLQSRVA